ncbi:MAG: hypothetical protein HY544_00270 [Candidatus Diapherotrites archaeon]|uniref:Uncharacterized protein n=1 Tax=Candidatus Iainarchaeum sp. TaxID=3101447 RepID=A0A8T3YM01_9ARCH|nr:hypothetical protein [Candidatus Diapherotrites archaeon]
MCEQNSTKNDAAGTWHGHEWTKHRIPQIDNPDRKIGELACGPRRPGCQREEKL